MSLNIRVTHKDASVGLNTARKATKKVVGWINGLFHEQVEIRITVLSTLDWIHFTPYKFPFLHFLVMTDETGFARDGRLAVNLAMSTDAIPWYSHYELVDISTDHNAFLRSLGAATIGIMAEWNEEFRSLLAFAQTRGQPAELK